MFVRLRRLFGLLPTFGREPDPAPVHACRYVIRVRPNRGDDRWAVSVAKLPHAKAADRYFDARAEAIGHGMATARSLAAMGHSARVVICDERGRVASNHAIGAGHNR